MCVSAFYIAGPYHSFNTRLRTWDRKKILILHWPERKRNHSWLNTVINSGILRLGKKQNVMSLSLLAHSFGKTWDTRNSGVLKRKILCHFNTSLSSTATKIYDHVTMGWHKREKLLVLREGTSFYKTLYYLMASFLIAAVPQNEIALGMGNALRDITPGGHWVAYCFQERFLMELHWDVQWYSKDKSYYHRKPEAFMLLLLTFISVLLLTSLSADIMHMCRKSILMIRFPLLLPHYRYTGNSASLFNHVFILSCLSAVDSFWLNLIAGDIWHH